MRHIICHGGVITEEMAASLLDQLIEEVLADNLPPPSHFEPPTLHELYDVDETCHEGPKAKAVSQIFPESVMLAVQEGIDLFTFPPAPGSPEPSHLSWQPEQPVQRDLGPVSMPNRVPHVIDLTCHEAGFPPSDDEDEEGEEFVLDYVEHPGHGCRSCHWQQRNTGAAEGMCSLCYMRTCGVLVYSPLKVWAVGDRVVGLVW
ncbi:control protein E1A [Human mastadenovirus C]|uniref:Early E1A protein n=1 Tax=Human mastadenovirus C TaxID=129951 RepID=A0A7D0TKX5_9ADEN|nr:control protein E1A [Human mastadenovirus C]